MRYPESVELRYRQSNYDKVRNNVDSATEDGRGAKVDTHWVRNERIPDRSERNALENVEKRLRKVVRYDEGEYGPQGDPELAGREDTGVQVQNRALDGDDSGIIDDFSENDELWVDVSYFHDYPVQALLTFANLGTSLM